MKKAPRNFLFALVLIIFGIVAPILILYALGYRYDDDSHALRKTATIGLEFESQSIKVYFDDIFIADKKDSVIIPGVTSALHHITLTKNDALSWEQDVETSPGKVSWLSNIILYRANLGRNTVTEKKENVLAATPSMTQNSFATVVQVDDTKNIQIRDRKTQNVTASTTETAVKNSVKNVASFSYEKMFFTQNDSWLVVPVVLSNNDKSFIAVSTKDGSFYSLEGFIPANAALFADANDQSVYFSLENGKRKTFNLQTKVLSAETTTLYSFHKAFTTYTIEKGTADCSLNETLDVLATKKTLMNFPCGSFEVAISPSNNLVIANRTSGEVFFFDTRAKNATNLEKNATHFVFAAKPTAGDVMVYLAGSELRAFKTEDSEKTLISRTASPIQDILVSALGTHVYFLTDKTLTASEIAFDRNMVSANWDLQSPLGFLLPGSSEQTLLAAENTEKEGTAHELNEITLYDL